MSEESIFAAARELNDPREREAYLDRACASDPALRRQVESLLAADSGAGSFLDQPPPGLQATIPEAPGAIDTPGAVSWAGGMPFLLPCETPGRLGKLVGKNGEYEVIEVVGQGGMGVVLRAFETKLSRIVAVKVMAPELAANPTAVKRFQREAQSAAAVHHDHVVTIHAVDEAHRPPFIVMQFVEGQTLQQKLDREGALELKQILRIGSQMAAGLAAAHKHGLIHRDVKPANVLLENGVERVKITDFGLARAADDLEMTQTGIIAGTPQYMSPEQAKGEPIDSRSDLFSLGSVLYTMCAGRPAFRADNPMAVMRRVCDDIPRPLHEINREIPPWLEAIVAKLMAKNPAERFQSATEVAELLGQHLAHLQNPAQVPRPENIGGVPGHAPQAPRASGKNDKLRPVPRQRAFWLGIAGVLCGLAGFALFAGFLAYRVATNRAFITVQVREPELIVTLDGYLLPLSPRSGGAGVSTGPNWIAFAGRSVTPGRHQVKAMLGDKTVHEETLVVGRGEDVTVFVNVPIPTTSLDLSSGEWIPLFDGKGLSGWTAIPPHSWRVENGVIHGSGPDAFLVSHASNLADFHLMAEFRLNAEGDSGIHFRMPTPQTDPSAAWGYRATGLEAEIGIRKADGYRTGALTVKDPGARVLAASTLKAHAANEWKRLEIIAVSDRIRILVDGAVATDFIDRERKFRQGHIALASWEGSNKTLVEFRSVKIRQPDRADPWAPALPSFAVAPFSGEQAGEHQRAWAKALGTSVEIENSLGMKLRLVPPGEFLMGSTEEESRELARALDQGGANDFDKFVAQTSSPQHRVRITRPFYLGACEVTVGQYRRFVEATGHVGSAKQLGLSRFDWTSSALEPNAGERAVIGVSWDDAKAFCRWLSERESLEYDLPSEAQWEFACRAGTRTAWSFGDDAAALGEYAVFGRPSFWPAEVVGSKRPNPFGMFDMHGNADEWCLDWHDREFYGQSPVDDPVCLKNPEDKNSGRVARGGTSHSAAWWTRSTTRPWDFQATPNNPKGFRVALVGDVPRPPPSSANLAKSQALQDLVASKEEDLSAAKARFEAQQVSVIAVLEAQIDLLEARIRLAEAAPHSADAARLWQELITTIGKVRDHAADRVAAGIEVPSAVNALEARLADARARMADALGHQGAGAADSRAGDTPLVISRSSRVFTGKMAERGDADVFAVAWSPDGARVATGHFAGAIAIWNAATGEQVAALSGHTATVNSIAFDPLAKQLATGGEDSTIRLWNTTRWEESNQLQGHTGWIGLLAFLDGGKSLLSVGRDFQDKSDNTIRLWELSDFSERQKFTETLGHNTNAAVDKNEKLLAIANGASGRVRLWDLTTGQVHHDFAGFPSHPICVAFSRDGTRLAAGFAAKSRLDGAWNDPETAVVRMWDVASGRLLQEFKGHAGPVMNVEFSPNDRQLLTLANGRHDAAGVYVQSREHSLRIWDIASGRERVRIEPPTRCHTARWAPTGNVICTGTRLWQIPE